MLIELSPGELEGLLLQMRLYEDTKTLASAAEVAHKIREIEPFNSEALDMLTNVLNLTGKYDEALQLQQQILESPNGKLMASPMLIMNYLTGLMGQGRDADALEFFENNKTRVVDPSIGVTIYRKNGKLSEADRIWDQVEHKSGARAIPGLQLRAAREVQQGNHKDAITVLKYLAKQYPRFGDLFQQLREIADLSGDAALVQTCDENISAMAELDSKLTDAIRAIGSEMNDPEKRIKVGLLQAEGGNHDAAVAWIKSAQMLSEEKNDLKDRLQELHRQSKQMFVPFREEATEAANRPAADASSTEPATDSDSAPPSSAEVPDSDDTSSE